MEDEVTREEKRAEKKDKREQRLKDTASSERVLTASYLKIKDTEAFADLLAKLKSFAEYHTKIAKDGVGFEEQSNHDGTTSQVLVRFTNDQKIDHLQRAAGIEEIFDYINRKFIIKPVPTTKKETK